MSKQPLAQIYAESNPQHARAVIQLTQPTEQSVVEAALRQIDGGVQVHGGRAFAIELLGKNLIVLTGRNRKHTPSLLLARARSLAEQLGCQVKVVPPPH